MIKKRNLKVFNLMLVISMVLSAIVSIPFSVFATDVTTATTEVKKDKEDLGLKPTYTGVKTKAQVYDDFENDIWLQYQQKALDVEESVDLRPWRVEQIVSNQISNDVARPNFKFEVISGDSVTLSESESTEKTEVKAVKPGTSIVQVTYDALEYKGKNWGEISPVNTGYAVFVVGQNGKSKIALNDELMNWRHYDTIYYSEGETSPYKFTVDTTDAKSTRVLVNGIEIEGNKNEYTADLENRSNIISIEATDNDGEISSLHRIVDARFIEVSIKNKENSEKELVAGDTGVVSFKGITMPIYKLATIYNPTWYSPNWGSKGTHVEYENDKLGTLIGRSGQYDLATKNSFEINPKEAGEYLFTSPKGIFTHWWGSKLGSDLIAAGPGEPNLNAETEEDYFSKMPNFNISVKESEVPTKITLNKNKLDLIAGNSEVVKATVTPKEKASDITWSSKNKDIATVDKSGKVSAVKEGNTKIIATIDGITAEVDVTVSAKVDKELIAHKEAANKRLAEYKNLQDYRKSQQAEINNILNGSKISIEDATDKETVNQIEKETKAKLDAVKTDKVLSEEEKGSSVIFSLEKFTIGQGFIIEPVVVPYKANENAAELFDRVAKENKIEYWNAGSLKKNFYLQGIENVDNGKINIPKYISEKLDGPTTKEALASNKEGSDLAEFDYHTGSGWYYQVDNVAASVGFADWDVKPNEVIRVQFTLVYGEDLTGTNFGGSGPKIIVSNKDKALKTLAEFNGKSNKEELLKNKQVKVAYDVLHTDIQDTIIPQVDIDKAVTEFNKAIEAAVNEDTEAKELKAYKDASKKELAEYKNSKDYRQAEQDKINSTLKEANVSIDKASDKANIDKIVKETKAVLNAIKTDKELTEQETSAKELQAYKDASKKDLAERKNLVDYRQAEQDKINSILKDANDDINKAVDTTTVNAIVLATEAKLDAVKTNKQLTDSEKEPQGDYIKDGRYVTITKKGYKTWTNFNWKERNHTNNLVGTTFESRGKYNHENGATYLSLFDNKGKWQGYLNEAAVKAGNGEQGAYINDGSYVTISKKGYNTWTNFNWKKRNSSNNLMNQTFQAKGRYNHFNGATYLSLYDNNGKWHGYINANGIKVGNGKQGAYINDGRYATITKSNYDVWSNFNWKKRTNSRKLLNQTFQIKGRYEHLNGATYYSLYNAKGEWQGYVNSNAAKIGNGKQGAYIKDGRKVTINKKGYKTWSNFNWKERSTTNKMMNKKFTARGRYHHANGAIYYSIYDNNGKWHGYINKNAVR